MEGEYVYKEGDFQVSEATKQAFDKLGYILVRGLLDNEELTKLKTALEGDEGIMTKAYDITDGGAKTKLCIWNHPGNDITGMVGRCEKVASTMDKLLDGEVYHYHTKLMMKEANGGGQFLWHQDYGYWYHNGLLFPDMATCFIAVDECTKENGCLQVLPSSHKLGRVEHVKIGGQMGVEPQRLEHVLSSSGMTPTHVEMKPGDALFFHCNLFHKSAQNNSPNRRWAFLIAYNRASNNPVKKHHHPRYVKLNKVPNSAIKECTTTTDISNKGFILQTGDASNFAVEDEHLN